MKRATDELVVGHSHFVLGARLEVQRADIMKDRYLPPGYPETCMEQKEYEKVSMAYVLIPNSRCKINVGWLSEIVVLLGG